MGFWRNVRKKVREWFSGGSSQKASAPAPRIVYNNRDSRNQTVSSNTGINKRAFLNSFRGDSNSGSEQKEENRVSDAFKATKQTYKSMADSNKESSLEKLNKALKKDVPDPKEAARQNVYNKRQEKLKSDYEQRKANREARQENRQEKHEAYHAATHHRYDVAEKGISDEEKARRRQNIRTATLGEMMGGREDEAVDVMKAKMKYDKRGESFRRGVANTASAGTIRLAEKRLNKGERAKAEEYYQENKDKKAETAGSFAGAMTLYGGTAGTFEGLGEKAVGRAAETQLGKKLGAEALKRTMAGTGAKAALTRSLVGDAIQDSTIGALDTTMDILGRDDLETPGDYLKAAALSQGGNYLMGLGGNLLGHGIGYAAPKIGKGISNFIDDSRKLRIVPKGTADIADAVRYDELAAERKRLMDEIFSKNEKSDPSVLQRIKEINEEMDRIKPSTAENTAKITDESVKNPKETAEPEAKITEDNVKKEAPRKPTKNEKKRAELQAERDELAERYRIAKEDGSMSKADLQQTLDDMQELDAMIKDLDYKISKAAKASGDTARSVDEAVDDVARSVDETAEAPGSDIVPNGERIEAGENANAGAGERTEFRRSDEETAREQARNRRTTNNRERATQESFDNDFAEFERKATENQAKINELKRQMRATDSAEEKAALKQQIDELNREVKSAYNRASLRYHPDRGGTNEWMGKFNEAFDKYRRGSYSSRSFRGAESSTRTRAKTSTDGGGNNTPPPKWSNAKAEEGGFKRPKGRAVNSEPSYVYRGEDTVFKRKQKPTLKERGKNWLSDARMRIADSHAPFEDKAREFAKSNPEKMQDMYGAINAHRSSNATATRSIHNKQLNYMGDAYENGKSLKEIYTGLNDESEAAFDYYLLLKHAPDRMREGKPIWETRALADGRRLGDPEFVARLKDNRAYAEELEKQIRRAKTDEVKAALQKQLDDLNEEIVRDTEETIGRLSKVWDAEAERVLKEHPEANFIERAKDVYQYTRNELQNLVDAGIVSRETADEWLTNHPYYVPTHRDGYAGLAGSVHGSSVGAKGVQTATGSDLDIRSIRDQLEEATRQNWEDITLNDMLKSTFGDQLTKQVTGAPPIDVDRAIENNIGIAKSKDGKHFYAEIRQGGEKYRVEIDKKYVDGLQDWNKRGKTGADIIDIPNEALSKVSKVFKDLITEKSPIFLLKNPMRDFPEAYANSRQPKEFRKCIGKAFSDLANGGPYSEALKNAGISQSSFFDLDKALLEEASKSGNPLKALGDKLGAANQFMEMWPRLTEYIATFERAGVPIEQASKELRNRAMANAADVTVNFGRSGNISKTINKGLVPFFNPSVQGWSKFVRNFSEQPNTKATLLLIARFAALGAGANAINNYFLSDNKNYQQISARDKANNYIIPVTIGEGRTLDNTNLFIKIPKSRFAAVYGLPTVNLKNENKMEWAEMLKVANDQIAPVSPIEGNIFAPIISTMSTPEGKTWYGTPIVPNALTDLVPSQQYDVNTSWFGKTAGKLTENLPEKYQLSPKKVDYLIDAETGVIGDFILPMTTPSRQGDSKNVLTKYGTPFVNVPKRAFTIDSTTQNDLSSRFYDQLQQANTQNKSYPDDEESKAEYDRLSSYSTEISGINQAIRHLQGGDSENKQTNIRELQKVKNQLMQDAMDGKDAPTSEKMLDAVQKSVGTTYAIESFGSTADKEAMKIYGASKYGKLSDEEMQKKIDADKDFYNGVRAIGNLDDEMSASGVSSNSALSKAVALASANSNDELFGAYGCTKQSRTESANKMDRARNYFKDGGSTSEYVQLEKARTTAGKLSDEDKDAELENLERQLASGQISEAEYAEKESEIKYNANTSYVGLATSLALANAPQRGYALYDIKDNNIRKGQNLAAMGFTARDYREMKKAMDTNGNGYPSKQEVIDYVANSNVEDKATLFDALYPYQIKYNPFGSVTNYSREQAAEMGRRNGIESIDSDTSDFALNTDNASSGYSGYGRRRGGYGRRRSGGSSKTKTVTPPSISQSNYKASKQTYKSMAETLKALPQTNSVKTASVKVEPPKVKFKKYEV